MRVTAKQASQLKVNDVIVFDGSFSTVSEIEKETRCFVSFVISTRLESKRIPSNIALVKYKKTRVFNVITKEQELEVLPLYKESFTVVQSHGVNVFNTKEEATQFCITNNLINQDCSFSTNDSDGEMIVLNPSI